MTLLGYAIILFALAVLVVTIRFILFPFGAEYLRRRRIKKVMAELEKSTLDNAAVIQTLKEVK